jgi:deoxyuridine 5'-triphosphate nucleotidohydrolase
MGCKNCDPSVCNCDSNETPKVDVRIGFFKEDERAQIPTVAYGGTSACYDLITIEDTVIPARGFAMVPNGLRMMVPKGWYVEFATRSGMGIGKNLKVHEGIIDSGYSGPLGVKVFNLSDEDVLLEAGKASVQCKTHRVPVVELFEASADEFEEYANQSLRGDNGFGSSDKK